MSNFHVNVLNIMINNNDRHRRQTFRVIDMEMMRFGFEVESPWRHRKKRLLSRPTRISKSSNKVMMSTHQVFYLIMLQILSMTTNAIIYLEDPVQAWVYDSLPDPPDKQSISNLFNLTEGGLDNIPFKVGTPLHYLTVPSIDKGSPSATPILSDELLIEDFIGGNDTSLLSNLTNSSDVDDNNATTVSLYNETVIMTNYTDTNITAPITINATNSTLFGRRTKSSLPSWDDPPPKTLSVDDELIPMKDISGEFTDVVHHNPRPIDYKAYNFITGRDGKTRTITELLGFFNDSKLVFSTESDDEEYVYYDSRQANFGVDLGPKGNAEFVNIMLPPRWGDVDFVVDSGEMEKELVVTNVTDDMNEIENVDDNLMTNITNGTVDETGTLSDQDDQSVKLRRLEDVDQLLGFQNASQTNDTEIGEVNVIETNQTQKNETDVNLTIDAPIVITNDTANGTATSHLEDFDDNQFDTHISSYFCLDDFERWRNSLSDVGVTLFDSSSSLNGTIASDRGIAIMVQRGRCSFENKAELAMLLNKLLKNEGKSDRIDHLIVYNNGTIDSKNNGTNGEEKLVEMFQIHENKAIDVGMLYITTESGLDLLNRISDRQKMLGISPYLDYSWIRGRHLESESTTGDKQNIIDSTVSEKTSTSDTITNGWYFPATLTRFCLSCGEKIDYGFLNPTLWGGEGHHYRPGEYGPTNWPNSSLGDFSQPQRWVEVIRRLMIATLVILIVGPLILASHRWHTVGGTIRVTTDENGRRRLRVISPSLEEFVEGVPDIVETNGTKLDRAQVFQLPEVVYRPSSSTQVGNGNDTQRLTQPEEVEESPPARSEANGESNDIFTSSSCCPICIEEFVVGEKLRVLPRCNHLFHIDCIMPWLTERQGCCPQCRTPVLPEELQRSRRPTSRRSSAVLRRFRTERQQGRGESDAALSSSRLSTEDVLGVDNTPVDPAPQDRRRGNAVPFGGGDENESNSSGAGDALNVSSPEMIERGVVVGTPSVNQSTDIGHAATVSADEIEVSFDAASVGEIANGEETASTSSIINTDGSTDIETTNNDDAYEAFLNFLKEPSVFFTGDE